MTNRSKKLTLGKQIAAQKTSTQKTSTKRKKSAAVNGSARPVVGERRREAKALKRDRLILAACETFYEHGYNATTVDMITAKLASTKAIFYYQFKDKHAILEEIMKIGANAAIEQLEDAVNKGGRPIEMLTTMVRNYARWLIDHQVYVAVFWREERNLSSGARAELARKQKRIDDIVGEILLGGQRKGEFDLDDVKLTSRAITGMITFTYAWFRTNRRLSRDDIVERYVKLALRLAGVKA